jgi:hypothetical protein
LIAGIQSTTPDWMRRSWKNSRSDGGRKAGQGRPGRPHPLEFSAARHKFVCRGESAANLLLRPLLAGFVAPPIAEPSAGARMQEPRLPRARLFQDRELGGLPFPVLAALFLRPQVAFGVIIYLITTNVPVVGYRFWRLDGAAARNWAGAEPIGARSARISLCLRGETGV